MAKLRVQATLIFDEEDATAEQIVKQIRDLAGKLRTIDGGGLKGAEASRVELHRCFHDEEQGEPCEVLDSWEKS